MKARKLHVLSYNIHKGFSTTRRRFTLNQMRLAIEQSHADLVFLQEVQGRHDTRGRKIADWPGMSQFEYLAGRVWPHMAYGKNAVYAAGHHGNAILSKYPIAGSDNLDISNSKRERRGLLHARIAIPGQKEPLHAICLHLDLREAGRKLQIDRLCSRIADVVPRNAPLVVAGDFNDWRQRVSEVLEERLHLEEVFMCLDGEHARTFPSWRPLLRLDRIYVRGLKIRKARTLTRKPMGRLSDHVAVFSELAF